ncbi:MAG: substrate-binding domain-containing protein [Ruminiclostridium sp.]|nr:substrate-binding domain-containing protein [Ruminiclostridium sp.]
MGKKTIAVIVGTNEVFFRTHALDGIVNQANALGYNVAVFFAFSMSEDEVKHQYGEENLYHLVHDTNIAGVIIVEYSFWTARSKEKVLSYFQSMPGLNAVILDKSSNAPYPGISPDDRIGFRDAVNHLIKTHGLKKICCLTGFKNVGVAEDRLQGYKDAMAENGLEVPDEYCIYGDFWLNAAEKLAVDIVEG